MKRRYKIFHAAAVSLSAAIMVTAGSCGNRDEKDTGIRLDALAAEEALDTISDPQYIYDHLDQIINQYGDIIMETPPDGQEMEELMMDINSRCYMLLQDGDTLRALYFHHAIENNVRQRDSVLADHIFGHCPYTAFDLHEEYHKK